MKILRSVLMVSVLSTIVLTSCNPRSTTTLCYYETQCADAYSHGNNDTEHITNINNYLLSNGVTSLNTQLELDSDSVMVCLACVCLSGTKVTIEVDNSDVAEANALGFQ